MSEKIMTIVFSIMMAIGLYALLALGIWNWFLIPIFNLPELTWKSLTGLMLLISLFKADKFKVSK